MASAPDFNFSRRQLRRSRIKDALGLPRGVNVSRHRDILIEPLAIAADSPVSEFGSLSEVDVDILVSLAISEVSEQPEDSLSILVMCVQALSADGQFARLALLGQRLLTLGQHLGLERPFLSSACLAFAKLLRNESVQALAEVENALSGGGTRVDRSRAPLGDILILSALRRACRGDAPESIDESCNLATKSGDGLAASFIKAVRQFADASLRAQLTIIVPAADETFLDEKLTAYLEGRNRTVLYPAQIHAIQAGATRPISRVVALPTSSGKTFLAELRVAATLTRYPGARAIYVAPYRLLARQVATSFSEGLTASLGVRVHDLGASFDTTDSVALSGDGNLPDIAIMTPERLDALMRSRTVAGLNGERAAELFATCRLIVFDELQLIGRDGRGPRIELLLTRLKHAFPQIEFLGLAAASHGTDALAGWLTGADAVTGPRRPTGTLEVAWAPDGKMRQRVAERTATVGELERSNSAIDDAVNLILRLDENYRPVLSVNTSRPISENLAGKLVTAGQVQAAHWWEQLGEEGQRQINAAVEEVSFVLGHEHPLANYLRSGVAFHHAGVPTSLLRHIERLASQRLLRVVCATTTVAEGADLPFRAVVVPHLNFAGRARKLERDLYLNLIGRAGRANVSVEGLVFVLESSARTLENVVPSSLWRDTLADRVKSALHDLPNNVADLESWDTFLDIQSQVLGWLGEDESYVDDQSSVLASRTFAWQEGDDSDKRQAVGLIESALQDLGREGFALAASPFRLTESGRQARLAGLAAPSMTALGESLGPAIRSRLIELEGLSDLSLDHATLISGLLLRSFEVLRHSLWCRRSLGNVSERFNTLRQMRAEDWPVSDEVYLADVEMLASWMTGGSFADIANIPPAARRANSMFGGDSSKRISDAAEYIGQMIYPAGMTWSAIRILTEPELVRVPAFVRNAIELGVPSESACQFVLKGGLSRGGASAVARLAGPAWSQARQWLNETDNTVSHVHGLSTADNERLARLQSRERSSSPSA